jgi:hypothetical protein
MKTSMPNRVRISIPFSFTPFLEALDLGLAFKSQAENHDGTGHVYRENSSIQVCLEGLTDEFLDELTNAYLESALQKGKKPLITSRAFDEEFPAEVVTGECLYENLTKRLLRTLPVGAFVISNVYDGSGSMHVANIATYTDRQRLWESFDEVGATHRKAWVVWHQTDADALSKRSPLLPLAT